jgi:hypothetical protein
MGSLTSPSSNGAVISLGIKVSLEMNDLIQSLANVETNGNKSEMIRLLITEALEERSKIEEMMENLNETE